MTTQTLIWYTPEEKTPEPKADLIFYTLEGDIQEGYFLRPEEWWGSGGKYTSKEIEKWADSNSSLNLPVMFGIWLSDWCEYTGSQDRWNYLQGTNTTEQLYNEFLKTL